MYRLLILLFLGFVEGQDRVSIFPLPYCEHVGHSPSATCCLDVPLLGVNHTTCIELAYNPNGTKVESAVLFDKKEVIRRGISVGIFCGPLPAPLSFLVVCVNVYYADVSIVRRYVDACFQVEIKPLLLQIRFGCLRLDNGEFLLHSNHSSDSFSLVNLAWASGRPSLEFNRPSRYFLRGTTTTQTEPPPVTGISLKQRNLPAAVLSLLRNFY